MSTVISRLGLRDKLAPLVLQTVVRFPFLRNLKVARCISGG